MNSQQTIAVVFGGCSSEHPISLLSASNIIKHLNATMYQVLCIGITPQGEWFLFPDPAPLFQAGRVEPCTGCIPCVISGSQAHQGLLLLKPTGVIIQKLDCVIPVLHGKNGEDGTIQGLLELANIPYVGCDVLSSSSCLDKHITHILLEQAGVPMAPFLCVKKDQPVEEIQKKVTQQLGYPVFVKPANAGSSVGVSKVDNSTDLLTALQQAFSHDRKVLVEQMIVGQEVECAMLGGWIAESSVVGEIQPANDFYDYPSKYGNLNSAVYIPARISQNTQRIIQEIAATAFETMGCFGLARIDFFVTPQQDVILNEINTFPGFTDISMYPMLWEHEGLSMEDLLNRLITLSKQRVSFHP